MTKHVLVCDQCGTEKKDAVHSVCLYLGTYKPGPEKEEDTYDTDICYECYRKTFGYLWNSIGIKLRAQVVKHLRDLQKSVCFNREKN